MQFAHCVRIPAFIVYFQVSRILCGKSLEGFLTSHKKRSINFFKRLIILIIFEQLYQTKIKYDTSITSKLRINIE